MNTYKSLPTFFVSLTTMFMLDGTVTAKQEDAGEHIDDTVITTKIKAAIFQEPSLKSTAINVEMFKGVVQLSGFAGSHLSAYKALEIARGIRGVQSVKDDMRVKQD